MYTNERRRRTGRYTVDFKRQSVELLLKSGRALKPLAHELGITPPTLRQWRDAYMTDSTPQGRVQAAATMQELRAQNEQMRREIDTLRTQRDILKKAVGILSEPPPRGMP